MTQERRLKLNWQEATPAHRVGFALMAAAGVALAWGTQFGHVVTGRDIDIRLGDMGRTGIRLTQGEIEESRGASVDLIIGNGKRWFSAGIFAGEDTHENVSGIWTSGSARWGDGDEQMVRTNGQLYNDWENPGDPKLNLRYTEQGPIADVDLQLEEQK